MINNSSSLRNVRATIKTVFFYSRGVVERGGREGWSGGVGFGSERPEIIRLKPISGVNSVDKQGQRLQNIPEAWSHCIIH
jgi:hypothetical protein